MQQEHRPASIAPAPRGPAPDEAVWERYDRFNLAIAQHFFGGSHAGRPVYLDLEDDAVSAIADLAGEPDPDARGALVDAVVATLQTSGGLSVFGRHRQRRRSWLAAGREGPPPTVAVLALLSLVAESMQNDGVHSAGAYYSRCVELIGGDPDDQTLEKRVREGHRKDVVAMWSDLNSWLELNPSRGLPTAYAFDHRTYIGPSLTQALVREADRATLLELFAWARLFPGQDMSREDMMRLLREWIPSSRLSKGLKKLCDSTSALEQVADVALAELRAWDGAGARAGVGSDGLRLVGRLRRRPTRRLDLGLLARLEPGEAELQAGTHQEPVLAIEDEGGECLLQTDWALAALESVTIVRGTSGSVRRSPSRLIVMKVEADRGRLVEVSRALLGERHVLIVRDAVQKRIEDALTGIARPGWNVETSVRGLPEGWVLFTDVEVVALGEFQDPERNSLVPTSWSQMSLHGGFRLPGVSRWLACSPPEISVSVLDGGEVSVAATLQPPADEDGPDDAAPLMTVLRSSVTGVGAIDLDDVGFEPGRYYLTASRPDSDDIVARTFLDLVAPDPAVTPGPLGHSIQHPLWPVTASPGGGLQGAVIPERLAEHEAARVALTASLDIDDSADDDDEQEVPALQEFGAEAPECFKTGYHLFQLGDKSRKGHHTACTHCGMEKFIPPRPPRNGNGAARTLRLPALPPRGDAHENEVLYALSAVGSGNRAALERIIEQVDDAPWALDERARTLSALGHIDLAYDSAGRIESWCVAPPVLALDGTTALLCGWRSPELVESLAQLSKQAGGRTVVDANGAAPERITVCDLDNAALQVVAGRASQTGIELRVVSGAARLLAAGLPAASSLVSSLRRAHGAGRIEHLVPTTWEWASCDGPVAPGAYRTRQLPRRYYFFDGDTLRASEGRLARWLAVPASARHLAYDPNNRVLMVPLGARLPGLWERAAVLASGLTPQRAQRHIAYREVPQSIAESIAGTLAAKTEQIAVA